MGTLYNHNRHAIRSHWKFAGVVFVVGFVVFMLGAAAIGAI